MQEFADRLTYIDTAEAEAAGDISPHADAMKAKVEQLIRRNR